MTHRRRLLIAALPMVALACDPGAGVRLRTAVAPVPTGSCVDSALARSPLLELAEPAESDDGARDYFVRFVADAADTVPAASTRMVKPREGVLEVRQAGDSTAQLTLSVMWLGRLEFHSAETRRRLAERGAELLGEVGRACASGAPPAIECEEYETLGHQARCSGTAG